MKMSDQPSKHQDDYYSNFLHGFCEGENLLRFVDGKVKMYVDEQESGVRLLILNPAAVKKLTTIIDEIENLRGFAQFCIDGFDNQDINHEDYRIQVWKNARYTLELAEKPTSSVCKPTEKEQVES